MQKNDQLAEERPASRQESSGKTPPSLASGERRESPPQRGGIRPGKILIFLVIAAVLVFGAFWLVKHAKAGAEKKPGAGRMELPPVPVTAGVVAKKDVPIYLEGLGTVQAFNTVTIHARVDGQLEKVAFVEGQDVRAGDLLAQIDPAPFRTQMEQAAAKKGQDEAQLANAQVDLKRYAGMLANEGVTQQIYDTQKALVTQLQAAVKADQAAIESARVQLDYATITSPIDGRTGLRLVDQGNIVHANDANGLVVITQLRPISVVFTLPDNTLGKIQEQSPAGGFTVLAVGEDDSTVLAEGKLAVLDNQIDTTTGMFKLKATFPNADLRLWPGLFVNARLLLTVRKDSAVVPASVIQRGPGGSSFAFVIKDDQTVDIRPVKVGPIEQNVAVVEEGLTPGERVVVEGQFKLQKGSRVKVSDGAAPGGGGKPKSTKAGGTNAGKATP